MILVIIVCTRHAQRVGDLVGRPARRRRVPCVALATAKIGDRRGEVLTLRTERLCSQVLEFSGIARTADVVPSKLLELPRRTFDTRLVVCSRLVTGLALTFTECVTACIRGDCLL